ncbi:MAG: Jag N-terminal domain-containing protein [Sulfurospirillaceae bacterium]|nr:Jag N-terminal domain-containing protein [Sulfurospirillaceae bacterium]
MIRIEATTLEEAYSKAASELSCSVVDLKINIIQNASSGFLGMFKKNSIIEAEKIGKEDRNAPKRVEFNAPPSAQNEDFSDERRDKNRRNKNRRNKNKNRDFVKKDDILPVKPIEKEVEKEQNIQSQVQIVKEDKKLFVQSPVGVLREFHQQKKDVDEVLPEVKMQITNLFKYSCFTLGEISVSKYNDETILLEFSGEDAALLIGKEGYRYKALSYLLYNWINIKYGLGIRLEIAEFLKNQEEMIAKYLVGIVERIKNTGRGQTRILDGVLIKIALEILRSEFPDKYVGIKSSRDGGKFIVVNDFNRKAP